MGPKTSSVSENWKLIFNGLIKIIRQDHSELAARDKERKELLDRVRLGQEKWAYTVKQLEDQIAQLEANLVIEEKKGLVNVEKLELLLGMKEREAALLNLNKDALESEVEDFVQIVKIHAAKESSDSKGSGESSGKRKGRKDSNAKLSKQELVLKYDKLESEKKTEVAVTLARNQFLWNQLNVLEKDYTKKLKNKLAEAEQANAKVENLLDRIERLESSNKEKDGKIELLTTEVAKHETESTKLKEENAKLSRELESLRKSQSASATPISKTSTAGTQSHKLTDDTNDADRSILTDKKAVSAAQVLHDIKMGPSRSKRNRENYLTVDDTPKLFSSKFKVPKLRKLSTPSSQRRTNKHETESTKLKEENAKLSRELESLRKSQSASATPISKTSTAGTQSHKLTDDTNDADRSILTDKKAVSAAQVLHDIKMGPSRSKRNRENYLTVDDTPKLFSSKFKIPKLRKLSTPSSQRR